MKRSKNYKNKLSIRENKIYSIPDALELIKDLSISKFDGSIELHINLNLTEKEKSQPIRTTIDYKHPFGESKKILVFAEPAIAQQALEAKADYAGLDEYIKKIQEGWLDFDIVLATPTVISKVAVLGKTLGTRGLMPNVKSGTVTNEIVNAIKGYKTGRTNIKSDQFGIIHTLIGKTSNSPKELEENLNIVVSSILNSVNKPATLAFKSLFLSPTMGPSLKIEV